MQQLLTHEMVDQFLEDARLGFGLDTLQVARKGILDNQSVGVPSAFNLPTLFQYVTGDCPPQLHRALADVKATISVFRYQIFWESRRQCLFSY